MTSLRDSFLHKLQSEVQGLTALTHRIIQARTWRYPPKGMLYFTTHRNLWQPLIRYLIPLLALSIGVVATMFAFTYVPQSIILTFFNGPWAWITTVGIILGESSAIIGIIARHLFLEEGMIEVYDTVLKENGAQHLVEQETKDQKEQERIRDKITEAARKKFHPTSLLEEIKKSLIYAPLNFLPLIGTPLFLIAQARVQAPNYHDRYFYLKRFTEEQKREFIQKNKEGYLGFGIVALLLGMLPGVNVIISVTNMVGAAIWAADIEKGMYVSGVGLRREKEKEDGKKGAWTIENGVGKSTGVSTGPLEGRRFVGAAKEGTEL